MSITDPHELASRLPAHMRMGTATSSYQIEGAVDEDGRGAANWDVFCATPGAIDDGSSGVGACDHYHRMPADVAMMADLGMEVYRFSVAWPRILPEGYGLVEERGLAFYDRLVDTVNETEGSFDESRLGEIPVEQLLIGPVIDTAELFRS